MLTEGEAQALADLVRHLGEAASRLVMVGAGARLIGFDARFDLPHRSTTDWDFGVRTETWRDYEATVARLVYTGLFRRDEATLHRLHHITTGTMVDLVPFGGLEDPPSQLTWPRTGRVMNTLGLDEASRHADEVSVGDVMLRVASMPCFVALKLIAFSDRPELRHLQDVDHVIANYADPNQDERVFEALSTWEELDTARPWLLGQDLRADVSRETLAAVDRVVTRLLETGEAGPLASLIRRSVAEWDASYDVLATRFEMFAKGLRDQHS